MGLCIDADAFSVCCLLLGSRQLPFEERREISKAKEHEGVPCSPLVLCITG